MKNRKISPKRTFSNVVSEDRRLVKSICKALIIFVALVYIVFLCPSVSDSAGITELLLKSGAAGSKIGLYACRLVIGVALTFLTCLVAYVIARIIKVIDKYIQVTKLYNNLKYLPLTEDEVRVSNMSLAELIAYLIEHETVTLLGNNGKRRFVLKSYLSKTISDINAEMRVVIGKCYTEGFEAEEFVLDVESNKFLKESGLNSLESLYESGYCTKYLPDSILTIVSEEYDRVMCNKYKKQ